MTAWGGSAHMTDWEAVMWRAEVDPRTRSSGVLLELLDSEPEWERLVAAHARLVEQIPRLRDLVVEPIVPLVAPAWSPDPRFDLTNHLDRVRLESPGGMRELLELTERVLSRPLHRARPQWEAVLVEGLEGGRAAYILKLHHSLTDGQGLVQLLGLAHSRSREQGPRNDVDPPLATTSTALTPATLLTDRVVSGVRFAPARVARHAGTAMKVLRRTVTDPRAVVGDTIAFTQSLQRVLTPPPAERSPLLRGRGSDYSLVVHEVPLRDLKAAGKAAGGSVNDAFLAGVLGGFRRYHEAFGVPVDRMPIGIPVSVRNNDDPAGGNRFAAARFAAPVGEPDARKRIQAVRDFVTAARAEPAIGAVDFLAPLVSRLPQGVLIGLTASLARVSDVQASNVAGPDSPLFIAGARVTHTYMFGPRPGVAAMVAMLSYDGICCLALNVDPSVITDQELFADCLRQGFDEVLGLRGEQ